MIMAGLILGNYGAGDDDGGGDGENGVNNSEEGEAYIDYGDVYYYYWFGNLLVCLGGEKLTL